MEKLNKVIAGLDACLTARNCTDCPYNGTGSRCVERVTKGALAWLKEQNRLISELSDNIPCCDNCEGKTVFGERTDECVYEIEGFDSVLYCAKRGIANCFGYRKKIEELEGKLREAEPVVHAHWIPWQPDSRGYSLRFSCSNCERITEYYMAIRSCGYDYCPHCGAHMDEEVADG